jgi:glutathione S-transferase
MELYFSPLACSLATRIALYEAGAEATFVEVDPKTKKTATGLDFHKISSLGLVPVLRTDDGEILTENGAILAYVAELYPGAELGPVDPLGRLRLRQWLSFVATELHKSVFSPLLDAKAPEGARAYALSKAASSIGHVAAHLHGRPYLLERFSVADAYLVTILNWCAATPVDLRRWPVLAEWAAAIRRRPSVTRAIAEERSLYARELLRHPGDAVRLGKNLVQRLMSGVPGVEGPARSKRADPKEIEGPAEEPGLPEAGSTASPTG